jgi:hypothetical protein
MSRNILGLQPFTFLTKQCIITSVFIYIGLKENKQAKKNKPFLTKQCIITSVFIYIGLKENKQAKKQPNKTF